MFSSLIFPNLLPMLRITYIFWALLSLFNFELLGGLAIPVMFLADDFSYYDKFFPFLLPPLTDALIVTIATAVSAVLVFPWFRMSSTGKNWLTFLLNLTFLTTFLFTAENHKNLLIGKALKNHKPDCISIYPFLSSLSFGGQEHRSAHALFTEGGKTYFWSYSKLGFFEGQEGLSINFPCHKAKQ